MPRGGLREPGPGKLLGRPRLPRVSRGIATQVLSLKGRPKHPRIDNEDCGCELCAWYDLLRAKDENLRFNVRRYLTDKRDGKPAVSVTKADTRETYRELDLGDLPVPKLV